jgi:hypothetical protein
MGTVSIVSGADKPEDIPIRSQRNELSRFPFHFSIPCLCTSTLRFTIVANVPSINLNRDLHVFYPIQDVQSQTGTKAP